MLLMTINKFSKFGQIRIDQGLDLILESHAILCGMPLNSSVVITSGINIVSFLYGGFLGLAGVTEIP